MSMIGRLFLFTMPLLPTILLLGFAPCPRSSSLIIISRFSRDFDAQQTLSITLLPIGFIYLSADYRYAIFPAAPPRQEKKTGQDYFADAPH